MISISESFTKNKVDKLYLYEIMRTEFPKIIDEHWNEGDTTYSSSSGLYTQWSFQYFNELTIDEYIESFYLTWNIEQHILTPRYYILSSFVPLAKHYHVTEEDDDDKPFKITFQYCKDGLQTNMSSSVSFPGT